MHPLPLSAVTVAAGCPPGTRDPGVLPAASPRNAARLGRQEAGAEAQLRRELAELTVDRPRPGEIGWLLRRNLGWGPRPEQQEGTDGGGAPGGHDRFYVQVRYHGEIQVSIVSNRPIIVFTDGAAKGNPGPGGWGAIVVTRTASPSWAAARPTPPTTRWNWAEPSAPCGTWRIGRARGHLYRLHLPHPGHHAMGVGLAEAWVENRDRFGRAQPGPVGGTVGPGERARPRRGGLALGAGPRRHTGQRARRRDRGGIRDAATREPVRRANRGYELPILDLPDDAPCPAPGRGSAARRARPPRIRT
jgi:hypothetical protein